MIKKYGKVVDFTLLGRNIDYIKMMSRTEQERCRYVLEQIGTNEVLCCPICESTQSNEGGGIDIYGFKYQQCHVCGHLYVKNQPADLSKLYAEGSLTQEETYINEEIFIQRCQMISGPKVAFVLESINSCERNIASGELWVDLGCGVGEILYEAQGHGWSVMGFDADPNEVSFANKKGLPAYNTMIDMSNLTCEIIAALKKSKNRIAVQLD